jgi:hypothetical protein
MVNPLLDNEPTSEDNRRFLDIMVLIAGNRQLGSWRDLAR